MAVLALFPPAYIGVRISGAWDGRPLVDLADGKAESVAYRLRAEGSYVKKVVDHDAWFGFGGTNSEIYDLFSQGHLWPDGWWIHQFRRGGWSA